MLVVDHDRPGTDTMSTHALMRGALMQLQRWGLLGELAAQATPPVKSTSFIYADGQGDVDIRRSGGIDALRAPRRTVLDPVIVAAARRAGARFEYLTSLRSVRTDRSGRVCGAVLRNGAGEEQAINSDIVIGADGRRSGLARLVQAETLEMSLHASAVAYSYFPGLPDNAYRWYWREGVAAGAIPTNGGMNCVFVAIPSGRFREMANAIACEGMSAFARDRVPELAELPGFAQADQPPVLFRGERGHLRRSVGPGWALVGDAAYFKDPLTAHGISDALRDAEILSRSILAGRVRDYPVMRDPLCHDFFRITDRIASFQWDMQDIRELHVQLNREMKAMHAWMDLNFEPARQAA